MHIVPSARPHQFAFDFLSLPQGQEIEAAPKDLNSYDRIIVAWSGGKDSAACVLHLLEQGADRSRMELWHHDVDGREGGRLMDWPCTPSYCAAVGRALGIPVRFSWRQGGFVREMLRNQQDPAPVIFEDGDNILHMAGGNSGRLGTRLRFPQVSGDLNVRWCSGYGKVMVSIAALTNQDRFLGKRLLFVTGERAEESAGRAKYSLFEPHKTDTRHGSRRRRHVDHWRPVHGGSEAEVWAILERWSLQTHPCYRMGWSRASCAACIFSADNHWASLTKVLPVQFEAVAAYEEQFGTTIARDLRSVRARAASGRAFAMDPAVMAEAQDEHWDGPVILPRGTWTLPVGAFGSPDSGPC